MSLLVVGGGVQLCAEVEKQGWAGGSRLQQEGRRGASQSAADR